jgi:hypothetical protein
MQHLEGEVTDTFAVTDDSKADWCLRKIQQARQNIAKRADFVDNETLRLRNWQEAENKRDQDTISFMESQLAGYFEQLRESGALGKRKSYNLPHGTLATRKAAAKLSVDKPTLLAWLKANNPQYIVVKEEPAWGDFKKEVSVVGSTVIANGGLVVDGVTVEEPEGETFAAKTEEA